MANDMLRKWNLDRQCQKSVVIVLAVDDRKFWVARGPKVPVYGQELTDIFSAQVKNIGLEASRKRFSTQKVSKT